MLFKLTLCPLPLDQWLGAQLQPAPQLSLQQHPYPQQQVILPLPRLLHLLLHKLLCNLAAT
jgi:hypothetical protein